MRRLRKKVVFKAQTPAKPQQLKTENSTPPTSPISNKSDPGIDIAEHPEYPATELVNLLNHFIFPRQHLANTLDSYLDFVKNSTVTGQRGVWIIRDTDLLPHDVEGTYAIHWPSFCARVAGHSETSTHLRKHGIPVRTLQTSLLRHPEARLRLSKACQATLLAALPPGASCAAESAFLQDIVRPHVPTAEKPYFETRPLAQTLDFWTFFRLGDLSNPQNQTYAATLDRYRSLYTLALCKLLENLPSNLPPLLKTLLLCLERARDSEGQGWARWGIAWTRDGLVFNYDIALKTLRERYPERYALLSESSRTNLHEVFSNSSSYTMPLVAGQARLNYIARIDDDAQNYMTKATAPYMHLFERADSAETAAYQPLHNTPHRVFFPLPHDTTQRSLLKLLEALLNEPSSRAPELETTLRALGALGAVAGPPPHKRESPRGVLAMKSEHFGCARENPPVFRVHTWRRHGEHYFSIPEYITDQFPEFKLDALFAEHNTEVLLQWKLVDGKYVPSVYSDKKQRNPYPINTIVKLPKVKLTNSALVARRNGILFFHPIMFRPKGEIRNIIEAILKTRPDVQKDFHLKSDLDTLRTFWIWVYGAPFAIQLGMVVEEPEYLIGSKAEHYPQEFYLTTPAQRVQYLVDKAESVLRTRLCDINNDGEGERSKTLNSYDNFAIWYAIFRELKEMPWRFTNPQVSEYITKRWLPWRRARSIRIEALRPYVIPMRQMFEGRPHWTQQYRPVDHLLLYAEKKFGPSLTDLAERTELITNLPVVPVGLGVTAEGSAQTCSAQA